MKITSILFAFFCSLFVQTAIACEDPKSQKEMNYCAGSKFKILEKELEIKVKKLKNIVNSEEGARLINSSQIAWLKYRELQCASISNIYKGGSIHHFIEYECKSILTNRRINNIKKDYSDTVNLILQGHP